MQRARIEASGRGSVGGGGGGAGSLGDGRQRMSGKHWAASVGRVHSFQVMVQFRGKVADCPSSYSVNRLKRRVLEAETRNRLEHHLRLHPCLGPPITSASHQGG